MALGMESNTQSRPKGSNGTTPSPPPLIGKAGRYTVFIKPPPLNATSPSSKRSPSTPSPSPSPTPSKFSSPTLSSYKVAPSRSNTANKSGNGSHLESQERSTTSKVIDESPASFLAMISNAIAKIQNAHLAMDEYLADWFGLNQSKYQWYVDEYMEMKKMEAEGGKSVETLGKGVQMPMIREQMMKRDDPLSP